jgi:hypothetical protein
VGVLLIAGKLCFPLVFLIVHALTCGKIQHLSLEFLGRVTYVRGVESSAMRTFSCATRGTYA